MPQPRDWCDPKEAFGDLYASSREWLPPTDRHPAHLDWADFRAAVVQHVIALHVREHKNDIGMVQDQLERLDPRASASKWNARLRGRIPLNMRDLATLISILPGALPTESEVKVFLDVAEGRAKPPAGWRWAKTDTSR